MQTIPVIYSRSRHPFSYAIRWFDRQGGQVCPYSHVGVITEDGQGVIESLADTGVVISRLNDFIDSASAVEFGRFPCRGKKKAYERAYEEVGKGYDLAGAISLGIPFFGRDWENPNSWFCSELLAHASGLFERDKIRTIGVAFCYALTRIDDKI